MIGFLQDNAILAHQFPIGQQSIHAARTLHSHLARRPDAMLDPRLQRLADNIRRFILDSTYSASEVARTLDVDRSSVARWMTGERTPTMENLVKLADLLERQIEDFWNGPEALPATPEQRLAMDYMAHMTAAQQEAYLALAASFVAKQ